MRFVLTEPGALPTQDQSQRRGKQGGKFFNSREPNMRRVDRAILAICLMLSTAVWSKAAGPVVITSAVTNSTLTQITINGQNFGATRPAVTLGGTPLNVMSFNATTVVAA